MILRGVTCLIVGAAAAKGIGRATAHLFAEHGAKLIVADAAPVDGLIADIENALGARGLAVPGLAGMTCDITDAGRCEELIEYSLSQFGRIDALVNTAGIVQGKPLLDISSLEFDRMIDVNLKGAFNLCQAALRHFVEERRGAIVNLASLAAQRGGGLVGGAHYASAKGGVISLTRTIAREYGPMGIRANVICPAMTQTGMLDGLADDELAAICQTIPLRRLGTPEEVAQACLFLASDLSSFVTGATLDVNGGIHIH
ncbi:short chain dehydrogenase family protein (plasmid) [Blastomonas sp. RAC04]|uniref:SDR family NAD(P)-dependent oxidoreductase n=1 Tax=Blastomonas sp. RAC04 TaxID=1842535 RepID=UPI00083D500A|nr:SDR family NAD(P)-dependent oxidoreductase [Blastomonas sp. RAC04]AOF98790.1 short chain dehydrogenase family protein [Blastomonas sp. RAC04]